MGSAMAAVANTSTEAVCARKSEERMVWLLSGWIPTALPDSACTVATIHDRLITLQNLIGLANLGLRVIWKVRCAPFPSTNDD